MKRILTMLSLILFAIGVLDAQVPASFAPSKAEVSPLPKSNVINDLLKGRHLYPYFMSDFVRSVPLGVKVKSLTTTGGGSSVGSLKLNMSAEARANADIAEWVKKMEDSGKFGGVELGPVSSSGSEGADKIYSFTLTSVYTPSL